VSPNDDLGPWSEDPLVRALTGPATGAELAGEAAALSAFRAAVPVNPRRRFMGRVGVVGGSAVIAAMALSGGVAAAYTASLPPSIQKIVHTVLGPIGVPPHHHHPHHPIVAAPGRVRPSSSPTASAPVGGGLTPPPVVPTHKPKPTHSATATPTAPVVVPSQSPSPSPTPTPSDTPSPSPSPTPTPTPTDTPTTPAPPVASALSISLSEVRVQAGGTVTVYGQLAAADGSPVADGQVWLLQRLVGQPGLSEIGSATTDDNGSVTFTTPPLLQNVRLRLITESKLSSVSVSVVVVPTIHVSVAQQGRSATISVGSVGGNDGDTVDLDRHISLGWIPVGSASLDANGAADFDVQSPTHGQVHYRVRLLRTRAHPAVALRFAISAQ
jgi:hypothetical protein